MSDRREPQSERSKSDDGIRRDYGERGCAGIVLAPVVLVALLLRGGRR